MQMEFEQRESIDRSRMIYFSYNILSLKYLLYFNNWADIFQAIKFIDDNTYFSS